MSLRNRPPANRPSWTDRSIIIEVLGMLLMAIVTGALGAAEPPIPTAAAPAAESQDLYALSLRELLNVSVDKVYTASRREQKTWEAPASVSIVTRDEIQSFGYRSLADVLRAVPGVYIRQRLQRLRPAIRHHRFR